MLLSDCWAAMVTMIPASAPAVTSCWTGTLSSMSVMMMMRMAPASTMAYRTIAACALPVTDSRASRARRANATTAKVAKTKNAAAADAAAIELPRCPGSNRFFIPWPNHKDTPAAMIASAKAMMACQGRVRAFTLAACFTSSGRLCSCASTGIIRSADGLPELTLSSARTPSPGPASTSWTEDCQAPGRAGRLAHKTRVPCRAPGLSVGCVGERFRCLAGLVVLGPGLLDLFQRLALGLGDLDLDPEEGDHAQRGEDQERGGFTDRVHDGQEGRADDEGGPPVERGGHGLAPDAVGEDLGDQGPHHRAEGEGEGGDVNNHGDEGDDAGDARPAAGGGVSVQERERGGDGHQPDRHPDEPGVQQRLAAELVDPGDGDQRGQHVHHAHRDDGGDRL